MWQSIIQFNLPGKNPGTSTNVTIGMLKESQNLTNLAPLTEAFISKQPGNIDKIDIYMMGYQYCLVWSTVSTVAQWLT